MMTSSKKVHLTEIKILEKKKKKTLVFLSILFQGKFYLFSHLTDAFIQSDLQIRTLLKHLKPTKEQQHASAITSPG